MASETIVAVFDTAAHAQAAIADLIAQGVDRLAQVEVQALEAVQHDASSPARCSARIAYEQP